MRLDEHKIKYIILYFKIEYKKWCEKSENCVTNFKKRRGNGPHKIFSFKFLEMGFFLSLVLIDKLTKNSIKKISEMLSFGITKGFTFCHLSWWLDLLSWLVLHSSLSLRGGWSLPPPPPPHRPLLLHLRPLHHHHHPLPCSGMLPIQRKSV